MREIWDNGFVRVAVGLIVGLGLIIYFNPPHTPCQSQTEVFKQALLVLAKSYKKGLDLCRDHPEPGGCVVFFETVNKIENKFTEVTRECQSTLDNDTETKGWITMSMDLIAKLAWGSKPPESYLSRQGWLELNQVVEFCRLRRHMESVMGPDAWSSFVNNTLGDLPGATELTQAKGHDEAWNRSLLSDPCKYAF